MLRARSILEARQYAELQPCERCGAAGLAAFQIEVHDSVLVATSRGYCATCGAERWLELVLADERVSPDAWGNADPSTIIDAGQWLALSDRWRSVDLARARDAVREVLKFISAGTTEPPRTAFFTAQGRALYLADRARFHRNSLATVVAACDDLLARSGKLQP